MKDVSTSDIVKLIEILNNGAVTPDTTPRNSNTIGTVRKSAVFTVPILNLTKEFFKRCEILDTENTDYFRQVIAFETKKIIKKYTKQRNGINN